MRWARVGGVCAAFVFAAFVVGTPSSRAGEAAPTRRFALVIGNNTPPHAGLATLRYADDDAVRWTILLRSFGAEVELLTRLDPESARLYGADAPPRRAPTRPELDAAMARLDGEMKRARASGSPTAFFFVYAGHGDYDDGGEGYVALEDGPFYRRDLERGVLAVSSADTNHVIVDACRSLYLALDRGPGGKRRPWPEPYFGASAAARFPNTGFLLASSSGGASHEWEDYQAGIFSHELRSGLLGGADANNDGRITYEELAAFVRVANQSIRNERFRPEMLASPPRTGSAVVLDTAGAPAGRVHFGLGGSGHQVLEDELGVRWADVHPGARQDLTLRLPRRSASESLFLRTADGESERALAPDADVSLAALAPTRSTVLRRGALHQAFALLFATPFDETTAAATLTLAPRDDDSNLLGASLATSASRRRSAAIVVSAGGVACLLATGALWLSSDFKHQDAANASGADRASANAEIDSRNRWAAAAAITGGVLAATAAALFAWSRSGSKPGGP